MNPRKYQLKRLASSLNLGYAVPLSLEEKLLRLEHDPAWITIELPIAEPPGCVEEVLVEQLDAERYRIASSPGMLDGLAADDIIALDAHSPSGYRLLQRGNNVCIHVFCDAAERNRIEAGLKQTLGRIGGRLDGLMRQTGLCFTVPVVAGFTVIEGVLQRVVGDAWDYANVYDKETNAPLNWWLKESR